MRLAGAAAGIVIALALVGSSSAGAGRTHRPYLPPPPPPELANSLAVDEFEFLLRPSKRVVAAGTVRINIYNRGEDDHNLVVVAANGTEYRADVASREASRIEPVLTPGRYQVYCDLFAGAAESHYDLGMVFELEVR